MKRIIIPFVAACSFLVSCSMDEIPQASVDKETVFNNESGLETYSYSFYNMLPSVSNGYKKDEMCDYGAVTNYNDFIRKNAYSAELSSGWDWEDLRNVNYFIENCTSEEVDEEVRNNYIGLARFFRAYFYWELFLRYGPIPLVTTVLDPDGDLLSDYTERPSLKEYVVDFVLKELQECESGLMTYNTESTYGGRIMQPVARALYSHIMLYMASPRYSNESGITWQQAADAAQSFIDDYGSNYALITNESDPKAALTNAWLLTPYTENNTEIIFYRNDGTIGWSGIANDTPVGEGGNGGLCPSQNLVDMYDMIDGSSPFTEYDETGAPVYHGTTPDVNEASGYSDAHMWENRDKRLEATILYHGVTWGNGVINVVRGQRDNPIGNANATQTGYYVRKLIPETILSNEHGGNSRRLWTYIRYAEILLNRAEALNEVEGPTEEVCNLLDQIRHRAGITGNVADRADLKTKDAMRNFIHKERTIELAFEEHRFWDVRRWGVAEQALGRDIIGIDVASDGTITRKVTQKRVFEEKMYLYPIPETEYWKTGIENNPGWN